MTINIAINGLGRIGRCIIRAIFENNQQDIFNLTSVNGPASIEEHAHLIKYDSVHGTFPGEVKTEDNQLVINGKKIILQQERNIEKLNWNDVDFLLECTGKFTDKEKAIDHITKANAKRVIVSSPCNKADKVIVFGVNNQNLDKNDQVISIGSCTTNCLAPLAKIFDKNLGIEAGFMTTIHSYTNDQRILDGSHKDLRRARSAATAIIPTSTGAAKSLGEVIPELAGKLDGSAVRVPTPNVSMIDLCFTSQKETSIDEINDLVKYYANGEMNKILSISPAKLVSIDFNHNPFSSIFDPYETKVIGKRFCRIIAWYDNEWGFSNRMLDVTSLFNSL